MQFPAKLDQLPAMLNFIRLKASHHQVPSDKLFRIELAAEEALVNIISYAYPQSSPHFLNIECDKKGAHRFEIVIFDRGVPFNPIDAEINVNKDESIEKRKIGGLGIFMIRKLVDEAVYSREGDENVLKLVTIL